MWFRAYSGRVFR